MRRKRRHVQNISKKSQHGLPRFDPSAGMMVQIIQVSASRASAPPPGERSHGDIGAIKTRLLTTDRRQATVSVSILWLKLPGPEQQQGWTRSELRSNSPGGGPPFRVCRTLMDCSRSGHGNRRTTFGYGSSAFRTRSNSSRHFRQGHTEITSFRYVGSSVAPSWLTCPPRRASWYACTTDVRNGWSIASI